MDRFTKSTLVYQGILNHGNLDFINNCIEEVTKDLDGDGFSIEFTLLCDPEVAILRAAEDGHERNKYDTMTIDKYKEINDGYSKLYYNNNNRYRIFSPITSIIDTTERSLGEVLERLIAGIDCVIKGCDIDE